MLDWITKALMWMGGAMMIGVALVTVGDVIARKAFSTGLLGLVDLTQFAVIGFAFLSMPRAFLKGSHVAIELYDKFLSRRADAAFHLFAALLSIAILILIARYGWLRAERIFGYGDISQNIGIPMWSYWAMFLTGIVGSIIVCAVESLKAIRIVFGRLNA